jgi:hypothetical protein
MIELLALAMFAFPRPEVVLRFEVGPYRPGIDAELSGKTPFEDIFGDGPGALLQPAIGVLFAEPLGTIGLELGAGWFCVSERALVDDGGAPSGSSRRSGGKTSLRVMPLSASIVARFDVLVDLFDLAVLPYAQAGLSYAFWRIGRGDDTEAASGATLGPRFSFGLALDLGRLDPKASLALERQFGIRGTELTVAVDRLALFGLGADHALQLADTTWRAGLGLRF